MKVRLLTSLAGAYGAYSSGDEYECSADEAGRLIERGFAEPIREAPRETAAVTRKPSKARK